MQLLEIILATFISTGIIAALLHQYYEKRLRTHELRIENYMKLIEELSKLLANEADWDNLRIQFNNALSIASDDVVKSLLEFNDTFFTEAKKNSDIKTGKFQ